MRQLIPNKNRIFETEKAYLEEKYRQGFRLEKKGWLFYQFSSVSPSEVAYEIDLAPKNYEMLNEAKIHECTEFFEDWEIVMTQPTSYKNLEKIYYLNPDPTQRFLVDEEMRIKYYKHTIRQIDLLALPFVLVIILWLATTVISLPSFVDTIMPYLFISSVILAIYSARKNAPFSLLKREIREKLGMEIEIPITYLISFTNPTVEQLKELDENLPALGEISARSQKADVTYYLIRSSIAQTPQMREEITDFTTVEKENIKIIRHSGIYSMPMMMSGWDREESYEVG